MLRRLGIDVPDTRAWRLEQLRDVHPVVEALLHWRKAERIATTFGYGWLDAARGPRRPAARRVGGQRRRSRAHDRTGRSAQPAGRAAAGGGGRAGPRVRARRPRPDRATRAGCGLRRPGPVRRRHRTTTCTHPWARLRCRAAVAKVAVLAAMYGQTSGTAGQALRGMETRVPGGDAVPQRCGTGRLRRSRAAHLRRPAHPYVRDDIRDGVDHGRRGALAVAAATPATPWCRARPPSCSRCGPPPCGPAAAAIDARIVLCLHDELLLHVPRGRRRPRRRHRDRLPRRGVGSMVPWQRRSVRHRRAGRAELGRRQGLTAHRGTGTPIPGVPVPPSRLSRRR
jgi:DNA polymerase-1